MSITKIYAKRLKILYKNITKNTAINFLTSNYLLNHTLANSLLVFSNKKTFTEVELENVFQILQFIKK